MYCEHPLSQPDRAHLRRFSQPPPACCALHLRKQQAGLQARGENLFLETAASGTAQTNVPGTNGLGALNQGFVETSNVNVTEELVNLITAQRAFEINSRSIQSSDQMLQKLTQL